MHTHTSQTSSHYPTKHDTSCVSISAAINGGICCLKKNDDDGWIDNKAYNSLVKVKQGPIPPVPSGAKIEASFDLVGWKYDTAKVDWVMELRVL